MPINCFATRPAFSEVRGGLYVGIYDIERTLSGTRVKKKMGSDPWVLMVRIARLTISPLSQQYLVDELKDIS